MKLFDHVKTASALLGAAAIVLSAGQHLGRSEAEQRNGTKIAEVRADLNAHTADGTMHPETVRRLNDLRGEVAETKKAANAAAVDAAATRALLERLGPSIRNATHRER